MVSLRHTLVAVFLLSRAADAVNQPMRDGPQIPSLFYPASFLPERPGQCEDTATSPRGKHALNVIDSDIRSKISNEIGPYIARSFGKCQLGRCRQNPAFSCSELKEIDERVESGSYWLRISNGSTVNVHCDFDRQCSCSRSDQSSWMRVALYNMSDSNQNCPFNFKLSEIEQRRLCHAQFVGCTSVFFDTLGIDYTAVCGRVIGVQFGEPNAFRPYFREHERTLEDAYVDGISLTHGLAPRTHVWTFAMAEDETEHDDEACPCTNTDEVFVGLVPPFIGNDYFCDTGSRTRSREIYYLDDPLWDGAGCGPASTCCDWQNPPWFCKTLLRPTHNSLEFRVCTDSSSDDEQLLLELIEIYIQ